MDFLFKDFFFFLKEEVPQIVHVRFSIKPGALRKEDDQGEGQRGTKSICGKTAVPDIWPGESMG